MTDLDPAKLHVSFAPEASPEGPVVPRVYTLTHSDATGDLFLTVGPAVNRRQISGWYTRLMRDEVVAEWVNTDHPVLHVHCHVSGGLVVGGAGWRSAIFRQHMPTVLAAFRAGDGALFAAHPSLDQSRVVVHFHARRSRDGQTEDWGTLGDYATPAVHT